jgi:C-terminal processing protease CtpA/Prc
MLRKRFGTALALVAMLPACGGGGGGGSSSPTPTPTASNPAPTPTPSPTAGCSLRDRQNWANGQLREWYLFPETLPASLDPGSYSSVEAYVDALTATARSQGRDRFFTYVTSIREEDAFYSSGSSAGFGFRLSYDTGARRVFVAEAFEGTPALAAGLDRGTEILAVGDTFGNLRSVSELMASGGSNAVIAALGPPDRGVSRVLRFSDAGGTREANISKTDYTLTPVSSRYGARIIDDGGKRVGYVNLRTFIQQADPALREAFAGFRAQGISEVIVDLRYNGGGLVSIAELMGDLLGGNRSTADVFSYTTFRPSKSEYNESRNFAPKLQSIGSTKIAFIGTGGSASASELVINAFIPYLRANAGLIGSNTYGKPVGQIALDRPGCDDRLRVIAFATQNAARQGDYYEGLASKVEASCQAVDDVTRPLGDPQEASTRAALDYLAGRQCTRIPTGKTGAALGAGARELLTPERPTTAQREVPGLF